MVARNWLRKYIDCSYCLPAVTLNGISIIYTNCVKKLGTYFDRTFSWVFNTPELSKRLYASRSSLRCFKNLLPIPTKITLVETLILLTLDYADVYLIDFTKNQLNVLKRLQNICIRFILSLCKYYHVFRLRLQWLPIELRRDAHIISLLL